MDWLHIYILQNPISIVHYYFENMEKKTAAEKPEVPKPKGKINLAPKKF